MVGLAAALTLWAGRGLTFRGDEWSWLTSGLRVTPDSILGDYNGHLLAFTKITFWLVPTVVGLGHYWVFRALSIVPHLIVVWLVYRLAAERIGPWPAVLAASVVAFLGTGSDVFLSAINVGIVVAVAACLGALGALGRGDGSRDGWACVLLTLGLASFSVAVAFAAGILVELLVRRQWRRLWVVVIPGLLYAAWRVHWGSSISGGVGSPGVLHLLGNAVSAMAGSAAGVAGVQLSSPTLHAHLPWLATLTEVLVVIVAAALLLWVVRGGRLTPRLVNLVVVAAALWLLLSFGRGSLGDLDASRYVYQGAVVVVLLLVELGPMAPQPGPRIRRPLAGLVGLTVCLNVAWLIVWANFQRCESRTVRAQLAALQLARPRVAPGFIPDADFSLRALTAGHYFHMLASFGGSPADSLAQLRYAAAGARVQADGTLIRALNLHLQSGSSGGSAGRVTLNGVSAGRGHIVSGCIRTQPQPGGAGVVDFMAGPGDGVRFDVPTGGLLLISARRFSGRFAPVSGVRSNGRPLALRFPSLGASAPWQLQARYDVPVHICARHA